MKLDLNADLGEGAGFDADLMPLITSANVCCGRHAGGPDEMRATLALAKQHGVVIGAHPGYDDRGYFGRREMALPQSELIQLVRSQIADLMAVGADVKYVKAHGALYNQACRDESIAEAVLRAVDGLPIVGLPSSKLSFAAETHGVPFIAEGFSDRRYRPDGSLVPRTETDAFVHDPAEAVDQVRRLIRDQRIRTICVHGDNAEAVAFTLAVRSNLLEHGFELGSFA